MRSQPKPWRRRGCLRACFNKRNAQRWIYPERAITSDRSRCSTNITMIEEGDVASVELSRLTKKYGPNAVVDDVSLTITHGSLVCLLGPSGCGKTTTLRLIAGFVEPTAGEI